MKDSPLAHRHSQRRYDLREPRSGAITKHWGRHGVREARSGSMTHKPTSVPLNHPEPPVGPPSDSYLCLTCRGVFYSSSLKDVKRTHTIVDVRDGADEGCSFCKLLWAAISSNAEHHRSVEAATQRGCSQYSVKCDILKSKTYLAFIWSFADWISPISIHIQTSPVVATSRRGHVPLRSAGKRSLEPSFTSSASSLGHAKFWLDSCRLDHPLCRSSEFRTARLPTRLLSIENEEVALRDASHLSGATMYATLSHRWGGRPRDILTTSLHKTAPVTWKTAELLATFRDAITVTKQLGLDYLWIDSLCIIHDSHEDRERECSRMCEVYGNSSCNIAATASMDGTEGLFRQHEAGGPVPCQITCQWIKRREKLAGGISNHNYLFWDHRETRVQIDESPLGKRAWVCQERFLAPRTLHFTENQVWWECRELYASEKCPHGIPTNKSVTSYWKQKWNLCKISLSRQAQDCYCAWRFYVVLYSKCELSRPEDKLVALAGMASRMQKSLQGCGVSDSYLAGLWKGRLIHELLWNSDGCDNTRPDQYHAPSWSWASVDGPVWTDYPGVNDGEDTSSNLIDAYTTTSLDPFGAVSAAALRICGPLARFELTGDQYDHFARLRAKPKIKFRLYIFRDVEDQFEDVKDRNIHALLLTESAGLFLEPVQSPPSSSYENAHGTFRRIGMFHVFDEEFLDTWTSKDGIEDPDLVYQERGEDGKYIVRII